MMASPYRRKNIAVFISGRGSNLEALIKASSDSQYPAVISLVVSNNKEAGGLAIAQAHHIKTLFLTDEKEILSHLNRHKIDIICLAGFMQILSEPFLKAWNKPILNIHPSLLPKHKGLHTHRRALAQGDTISGCTVHHVTSELDGGDIIAQEKIAITQDDDEHSLASRILKLEHHLYPVALKNVIEELS